MDDINESPHDSRASLWLSKDTLDRTLEPRHTHHSLTHSLKDTKRTGDYWQKTQLRRRSPRRAPRGELARVTRAPQHRARTERGKGSALGRLPRELNGLVSLKSASSQRDAFPEECPQRREKRLAPRLAPSIVRDRRTAPCESTPCRTASELEQRRARHSFHTSSVRDRF